MSELLVFIAVLVSNPLNSKTRCVKLPQCLFLWGSSCARSSWKSGREWERLLGGVWVTVRISISPPKQGCVSQGRSAAVSGDWRIQQINPIKFPGSVALAPSIHPNFATAQGFAFCYSPKLIGGRREHNGFILSPVLLFCC